MRITNGPFCEGILRSWNDTEKRQVEERLNGFLRGIIVTTSKIKKQREEDEELARQRQEAELRRQEEEERRRAAEALLRDLDRRVDGWHKARQTLAYQGDLEKGSESVVQRDDDQAYVTRWLLWARSTADELEAAVRAGSFSASTNRKAQPLAPAAAARPARDD